MDQGSVSWTFGDKIKELFYEINNLGIFTPLAATGGKGEKPFLNGGKGGNPVILYDKLLL